MSEHKIQLLNGVPQQYAWGKVGLSSMVAKLCDKGDPNFKLAENEPYAELWMGTHIKAPSSLADTNENLRDFVKKNKSVLGSKVVDRFDDLPYLFKVLSVAKALSIQAHPNKKNAEKLHAERPEVYKDPNHKPEMAIALTKFEALCNFRPVEEILNFLKLVPELCAIIGNDSYESFLAADSDEKKSVALKLCFSKVIRCEKNKIKNQLSALVDRVSKLEGEKLIEVEGELLLRLNTQFPGDVGCFVLYFLNHIYLQPGEAMFLRANVPHAYLDGDCIECMACSDNVVRAGFTPKLIDAETLIEMLEYKPSSVEQQLFNPETTQHDHELLYNPPIEDFAVYCVNIPSSVKNYKFSVNESASIVLIIEGKATLESGTSIHSGSILFVPSNKVLKFENISEKILAYRATCFL